MAKKRVTATARELGIHPMTLRAWIRAGKVTPEYSAAGQMVFSDEYIAKLLREANPDSDTRKTAFYVRVYGESDFSLANQEELLTNEYGKPDVVYKDIASGLKEDRKGLNSLLNACKNGEIKTVIVTHRDRLSRFSSTHLEKLLNEYDVELIAESDVTDEPHEVVMQDFMNITANFSGLLYAMRGVEQKRRLLDRARGELDEGDNQ